MNRTKNITLLGSLITSFMASACCIGPILFALLGVSSAGLLIKLEPYRFYITIIAILFLASSFYFTYKKKPEKDCMEGSYCANPQSDIWNKRILWIITFFIFSILTFPWWSIYLT